MQSSLECFFGYPTLDVVWDSFWRCAARSVIDGGLSLSTCCSNVFPLMLATRMASLAWSLESPALAAAVLRVVELGDAPPLILPVCFASTSFSNSPHLRTARARIR